MINQAILQQKLSALRDELDYMKKYVTEGNFGTVEQMIFTMHADLAKTYALLLKVQDEKIKRIKALRSKK